MRQVLPIRSTTPSQRAKVVFCGIEIDDRVQAIVRAQSADLMVMTHASELERQFDDTDWGCIVCGDQSYREGGDPLAKFTSECPGFAWILWISNLDLAVAVTAMQRGACNVLVYSEDDASLAVASASVADAIRLGQERLLSLRDANNAQRRFGELSESERQVLGLIMKGMTNKEISLQLDFSLRTVESRRQRILRVMQTENAITLAAMLAKYGMLDQAIACAKNTGSTASHSASA